MWQTDPLLQAAQPQAAGPASTATEPDDATLAALRQTLLGDSYSPAAAAVRDSIDESDVMQDLSLDGTPTTVPPLAAAARLVADAVMADGGGAEDSLARLSISGESDDASGAPHAARAVPTHPSTFGRTAGFLLPRRAALFLQEEPVTWTALQRNRSQDPFQSDEEPNGRSALAKKQGTAAVAPLPPPPPIAEAKRLECPHCQPERPALTGRVLAPENMAPLRRCMAFAGKWWHVDEFEAQWMTATCKNVLFIGWACLQVAVSQPPAPAYVSFLRSGPDHRSPRLASVAVHSAAVLSTGDSGLPPLANALAPAPSTQPRHRPPRHIHVGVRVCALAFSASMPRCRCRLHQSRLFIDAGHLRRALVGLS